MQVFEPRLVGVLVMSALISGSGCSGTAEKTPDPAAPEYTTTATVKELMLSLVDPSADVIWNSVGTIATEKEVVERAPKTGDQWTEVRQAAIRLVEASNLLQVPGRRVMHPHEKSEAPGVELEGPDMEALIDKDRAAWNKRALALHQAGHAALKAIDARDPYALFDVGEHIELACESCHSQYWYPNQRLPEGYDE